MSATIPLPRPLRAEVDSLAEMLLKAHKSFQAAEGEGRPPDDEVERARMMAQAREREAKLAALSTDASGAATLAADVRALEVTANAA